ncbi:MAG TPA: DUF3108 domain-containing protein [Longimicrobiales bacterium]
MRLLALLPVVGAFVAAVQPAAAQSPALDLAALVSHTDTFAFRINGQAFGTQVMSLERTDSGFVFSETSTLPNAQQTTSVSLDPDLRIRSVRQDGQAGGQQMYIDVRVADGRATGRARVPGSAGMEDRDIDAALPDGAIDDNVLMAILPALPWQDGAEFALAIFASGRNQVSPYTFRVTGTEDVTLPGGTFKAFRVEVEGTQPLVIHVAQDGPHRLLRLQVAGTPLELVRTGG